MKGISEQFREFFDANAQQDDIALTKAPPEVWETKGREQALCVFHKAAERVPAYKDFLAQNGIRHENINTFDDFQRVPLTDKETYLARYPLDQLCLDGKLSETNIISSSSGSTGKPFYWPRYLEQDVNVAKILELLFRTNFEIDKIKTLMVVSFGLGIWTAGIYMLTASRFVASKGYPLTIMSPGIDLEETAKVIRNVGPYYQQVILVGFPGFVKDVVDRVIAHGIDLPKMKLKVFTAGEVHTEPWRDYLIIRAGMKNEYKDITSVLASSEGGLIGIETPVSVYVRRACFRKSKVLNAFFPNETLPSIVQYNPMARFYETINQDLVLTSSGALPLIRFNTKDRGGMMSLDEVYERFAGTGIDRQSVKTALGQEPWSLPFAYVFGRSNLTVTVYGVNVYPESIKAFLLSPQFHDKITGRFTMRTSTDDEQNQFLEFFVESSPRKSEGGIDESELSAAIASHLKTVNSEFRKLSESVKRQLVRVRLRPFQDRRYFSSDKQKFVISTPNAS